MNRDVVCQLPTRSRSKTIYCCKIDDTCIWHERCLPTWNILDKALRSYGMVPTRVDRCCYVLYSLQSRGQAWEHWVQGTIAQQNGTKDAFAESRDRSQMEAAFEKRWIPQLEVRLQENPWQEFSTYSVDDLFDTGGEGSGTTRSDQT